MKLEAPAWIAVAAICVSILVAIFNKWWDPVAAHVGYPFGVHRRLKQLGEKIDQLSAIKKDVEYSDHSPSSEECKDWLKKVSNLVHRAEVMKASLNEHGLNYLERCKIGIEAEDELKKADALIVRSSTIKPKVKPSTTRQGGRLMPDVTRSLISQGHGLLPEELSVPVPLPGMEGPYHKVLEFIKDNGRVSTIMGVWGMIGVGKTTLINLVHDSRPLYHDYFVEVVFVQTGKGCTEVADLQKAIAITMGLDEIANEISQAGIIRKHLQDKDFLLLLDDLWKDFDLEVVGIPSLIPQDNVIQPHRRKVVFTTRSIDVCTNMECRQENTIQMKCLNKEYSWNLFAKIVGNTVFDNAQIHLLAKEIAVECSGLPMALCKIGKTVSALKDPREWRTTRDLLKQSKLHQLTGSNEDLFRRLQESYDNMTDDMKKRFLLCSMWSENENIPMKKLIRWWTGFGMLDRFPNNASDAGYTLINVLVRASMLEKGDTGLDSTEHSHVKMHSMIRKMAVRIVNEHGNKYKWITNSLHRSALREESWVTVEKAWVSEKDTSRWCQWSFKAHFRELKMLVAQHVFSLQHIQFFQNITFLDLEGVILFCSEKGKTPASQSTHVHSQSDNCTWGIICRLTELQYLNLSGTGLAVLSELLGNLSKLEYLYIRNNMYLQTIPRRLILTLKRLRGLDLFCTGACYKVLEELASSTIDLKMLGFTVRTVGEITKLENLETVCTQALYMHHVQDRSEPYIINLKFLSKLEELRELAIVQSFDSQKELKADGYSESDHYKELLPHLEIFELNNLLSLEKVIWKNAGLSIRVVSICDCNKLKDVTWVHQLKYLEELTVSECHGMERLIEVGESLQDVAMNQTATICFPRLQKLTLTELPKLSMISEQACQFEDLSCISVTQCNVIKNIHDHQYKKFIKIHCSEDWWTKSKPEGRFNNYLVPTFVSSGSRGK